MRTRKKMRLKCPICKAKAVIYSHPCSTEEVSTAYAKCKNPACEKNGHTFTTQVAFTGWKQPEVAAMQESLNFFFDSLPAEAKKEFLASASQSLTI